MFSFRGDAHRIYLHLKKASNHNISYSSIKELGETEEIVKFYRSLNNSTLKLIFYRMMKEKNGSGIIPIFVTAIPWFFFLFSQQLQELLFESSNPLWIYFITLYLLILTVSVILHFREKAWAAFHIEIIQDIIRERERRQGDSSSGPSSN